MPNKFELFLKSGRKKYPMWAHKDDLLKGGTGLISAIERAPKEFLNRHLISPAIIYISRAPSIHFMGVVKESSQRSTKPNRVGDKYSTLPFKKWISNRWCFFPVLFQPLPEFMQTRTIYNVVITCALLNRENYVHLFCFYTGDTFNRIPRKNTVYNV